MITENKLRQDTSMPRCVRPNAPSRLEAAIDALGGNHARVATLEFLVERGPDTAAEVAAGTGLGSPTVKAHLYQFADSEVVTAEPPWVLPVEEQTGRRAKYAVVSNEVLKHYEALGRTVGSKQ